MPLNIAPQNQLLTVVKVFTDEKVKKHLEALGITINSKLEVVSVNNGNLILKVKEGRLALDGILGSKILVNAA